MLWDWESSPSSKYGLPHDVYKMQNWVMPEISYIYHDNFLSSMTLHIINKGRYGGGYVLEKKKTKYFPSCVYVFVCVCAHTHTCVCVSVCKSTYVCIYVVPKANTRLSCSITRYLFLLLLLFVCLFLRQGLSFLPGAH